MLPLLPLLLLLLLCRPTVSNLVLNCFALLLLLLLLCQVADKAQKRALQSSYRLLRVWMQEIRLDVPYTSSSSSSSVLAEPQANAEQH
jgi:hypothetical protein